MCVEMFDNRNQLHSSSQSAAQRSAENPQGTKHLTPFKDRHKGRHTRY